MKSILALVLTISMIATLYSSCEEDVEEDIEPLETRIIELSYENFYPEWERLEYDEDGRLAKSVIRTTHPDAPDGIRAIKTYTYNAVGNIERVSRDDAFGTSFSYDWIYAYNNGLLESVKIIYHNASPGQNSEIIVKSWVDGNIEASYTKRDIYYNDHYELNEYQYDEKGNMIEVKRYFQSHIDSIPELNYINTLQYDDKVNPFNNLNYHHPFDLTLVGPNNLISESRTYVCEGRAEVNYEYSSKYPIQTI